MLNRLLGCIAVAGVIGLAISLRVHRGTTPPQRTTATQPALPQDVYVWQRDWNAEVHEAIADEKLHFRRFVILGAEIGPGFPVGRVTELSPDYSALARSVRDVGLAIRIGPLAAKDSEAMSPDSRQTIQICDVCGKAVADAQRAQLNVSEVQIDFDCAESKLAGYSVWIRAIRHAIAPVPIVITALPSWLKDGEFATLARTAGSFILQVHSLHKPTGPNEAMTLCDPDEARQCVAEAGKIGVSFRVALPTYSYLAGFSPDGKLLGLSADRPAPAWPQGTILRAMRSDPQSLSQLVRDWSTSRPIEMTGLIWYRLPVPGETMNWRSATLHAVMAGGCPHAIPGVRVIRTERALLDIYLENTGDADGTLQCNVATTLRGTDVIASEGMNGFQRVDTPDGSVSFAANDVVPERWIAPGDRIEIGWLRLSADKEVQAHVSPLTAH